MRPGRLPAERRAARFFVYAVGSAVLLAVAGPAAAADGLPVREQLPTGLRVVALRDASAAGNAVLLLQLAGPEEPPIPGFDAFALTALVWGGPGVDTERWHRRQWRLPAKVYARERAVVVEVPAPELRGGLRLLADLLEGGAAQRSIASLQATRLREPTQELLFLSEVAVPALAMRHAEAMQSRNGEPVLVPDLLMWGQFAPAEVPGFLKAHLRPERCLLAIVGEIEPERALRIARRELGRWSPAGAPVSTPGAVRPSATSGGTRLVSFGLWPEGVDAHMRVSASLPGDGWAALERAGMLAMILGADDGSRITRLMEPGVREAVKRLETWAEPGVPSCTARLVVALDVVPGSGGAALDAVRGAIAELESDPPSPAELDVARERLREPGLLAAPDSAIEWFQGPPLPTEEIARRAVFHDLCGASGRPLGEVLEWRTSIALPEVREAASDLARSRPDAVLVSPEPSREMRAAPDALAGARRFGQLDSPNEAHQDAVRALTRAMFSLQGSDLPPVVDLLEPILEETTPFALPRYALASGLAAGGERDEALERTAEALDRNPGLLPARLLRVRLLCDERRTAAAGLQEAEALLPWSEDPAEAGYQVARCHAKLGDTGETIRALRRLAGLSRSEARRAAVRMEDLAAAGRYRDATRVLARHRSAPRTRHRAWLELGDHLNDEIGDYRAAVEAFRRAVDLDPDDPEILASLGNALKNAGDEWGALAPLQRAVELDPQDAWAWRRLGDVLVDDGDDHDAAIDAYRRSIALDPEDDLAWTGLGDALAYAGRPDEALEALREATRRNPGNALAWRRQAAILEDLEFYEAAVEAIRISLTGDPRHAGALAHLGYCQDQLERHAEAEETLRLSLELDPDNAWAWRQLGEILRRDFREHPAAIEALQRACDLEPRKAAHWSALGVAYWEYRHLDAAVESARRALELDEGSAHLWWMLGFFLQDAGDHQGAIEAYRRSLQLDEENARTLAYLGAALRHARRVAEAEEALQRALAIDPRSGPAWFEMGLLLDEEHGDSAGAVDALQRARELEPENASRWSALGGVLRRAGRVEESLEVLEPVRELDPEHALAWLYLGQSLRDAGEIDRAVEVLRDAVDRWPRYVQVWIELGSIDAGERDDPGAALESYRRAFTEATEGYRRADEAASRRASWLNDIAWSIATAGSLQSKDALDLALGSAIKACELSDWQSAAILDTLAEVRHRMGRTAEALEVLDAAIRLAPDDDYYRQRRSGMLAGGP